MPSAPGPVPKRSDQRRRVNRPEVDVVSAPGAAFVAVPEVNPAWHELAREWFESLKASGQAVFYEPSDWASARVWAEVLSRQLLAGRMSAPMLAAWSAGATELLTTEGARRRARIELAKASVDEDEEASVASLEFYRDRLSG